MCTILNSFKIRYYALLGISIALISINELRAQSQKPNVIFILGDDVGYDLLSVNGNKSYSTPNLDSMAHHGINFTHCEATAKCSPSRCMLLTGKYNFRNYSNGDYLNFSERTFGNLMHDAGYKTGFFGKLQLPLNDTSMKNWGFDTYTIFLATDSHTPNLRYKSPTLFDNNGPVQKSITNNKYCDDILTTRIFNFIDENKANPFFIYYPMSLSHPPFGPTPDDTAYKNWDPVNSKSDTSYYKSMVRYMDKLVGKILNKLRADKLDSNTIILFAGDNGIPTEIYYNAGNKTHIKGEKGLVYEGGTHVPLITYWPGHIPQGKTNDDLIDLADFFATFADIGKVSTLSKYAPLDGLSFYARMLGKKDTAKQQLFNHYSVTPGISELKRWVRNKIYKLYDSTLTHEIDFYNIVNDPEEKHPLPYNNLSESQREIVAKFQAIMDSMPTWKNSPKIINPFVQSITENSAVLGATIINSGDSKLIERGSAITVYGGATTPTIQEHRQPDSIVALGRVISKRTALTPQTHYFSSIYAMNKNAANSTAYALDTFYTLSNPPTQQPGFFTSSIKNSSSVLLKWGSAKFPTSGATKLGYAIFYSTDSVQLISNPNGKNPSKIIKNGKFLTPATRQFPNLPDTSVTIAGLESISAYHFLLIPYTYNGKTDSTYNYLIKNALSTTSKSISQLSLKDTAANSVLSSLNVISAFPNPAKTSATIVFKAKGKYLLTVTDFAGKVLQTKTGTSSNNLNNVQLDISSYAREMYFITITDETNKKQTIKLYKSNK